MRLRSKKDFKPKFPHGTERVVHRFLLFPLELGGVRLWLQRAKILQRYHAELCRGADLIRDYQWLEEYWKDIRFVED